MDANDKLTGDWDPLRGTSYRALRELGHSDKGFLLEAEHRELGAAVCIALYAVHLAERPDLLGRFPLEAQVVSCLLHPNLAVVLDSGETPEGLQPFVVMEPFRGRTLQHEQEARGSLRVTEVIDIACQVLAGLAAAHDIGIVHGEITASSIFLSEVTNGGDRTVAMLLDFGIARIEPAEPAASCSSPEQADGRPLDQRSDLYMLGIVIYRLIAGRGPFDDRAGILGLSKAHASEIPKPPSAYASQPIPIWLDQALLRVLAKSPDRRFRSARAFARSLREVSP